MIATGQEPMEQEQVNKQRSLVWTSLRDFLLFTLALGGGYAQIDLYSNGQNIWKYLLHGTWVSARDLLARAKPAQPAVQDIFTS